jgi:hypothetical protein
MRHMRWVKDDNLQSAINANPELTANGRSAAQNRWIAYNKMRGQYASAMEHAVPEAFWVDKTQCRYTDDQGTLQNPGMADCAQGISAVKAIAIAQSEGQKIYTVTQDNAATALHKLPIGGSVGAEIRSAVQAGKEVTVHERAINAHGWSGYGYIVTDPETGAGGYIIEGKGNGGILMILAGVALAIASMYISSINPVWGILLLSISLMVVGCGLSWNFNDSRYFDIYMGISMTLIGALLSTAGAGIAAEIIPLILGSILTIGNVSSKCSK